MSKPKPIKSVIGLFRRESTTSGSVAGSDPCLAAELTKDLASISAVTPGASTSHNPSASVSSAHAHRANSFSAGGSSGPPIHLRGDRRRSISICAVTPIDESSENGHDPLGALIELENTNENNARVDTSYCRNNRRRSLFELNG